MKFLFKILIVQFILLASFFSHSSILADSHNLSKTLEQLQKDIKTLEKAVYSSSVDLDNSSTNSLGGGKQ